MFKFYYNGGVKAGRPHESEKFLLYFIVNGKEISFWPLLSQNIIKPLHNQSKKSVSLAKLEAYETPYQYAKLFIRHTKFGEPQKIISLFIKFLDPGSPKVMISPFRLKQVFGFSGHVRFLKTSEILNILSPTEQSYKYVKKGYNHIPVNMIKNLITVEQVVESDSSIRKIRI